MSDSRTLAEKFNSAPTAPSLSGLSAICVGSSGVLQKVSNLDFVRRIIAGDMDLNTMGSIPGVSMVVTSDATLNVPSDRNYGLVINLTFSEPHVFQIFFPYTTGIMGIYTRTKNSGVWKDWNQLV